MIKLDDPQFYGSLDFSCRASRYLILQQSKLHHTSVIFAIFFLLEVLILCKEIYSTMWAADLDPDTTAETSSEDVMYCERVAFAVKNMILDCQSSFPDTSSSSVEMSSSSYTPPVGNHHQSPCRNPATTPKSTSKKKQQIHPQQQKQIRHHHQGPQRKAEDWEISNITMATQCLILDTTAGPLSSTFKPVQEIADLNVSMETCCGEGEENEEGNGSSVQRRSAPSGVDSNDIQGCHFSSGYSSCGSGRSSSTSLSSLSSCSRLPPAPPTSFASPESLQSASQIYYNDDHVAAVDEDSVLEAPATPVSIRLPCEGQESANDKTPIASTRNEQYLSTFYRFTPNVQHNVNDDRCCCRCRHGDLRNPAVINMSTDSDVTMFQDIPLCRRGVALSTHPASPKSKSSSLQTIGRKLKKFRKHLHTQFSGNKPAHTQQDPNMKTLAIL